MGYRIIYVRKKRHNLRFLLLTAGFFGLFLYCLTQAPEITVLENLARQLGDGASIGEAVAAFCQDVIYGS